MRNPWLRRRVLVAGTISLLLGAGSRARAASEADATGPVRKLVDGLLQIMKAGRTTPFQMRFGTLGPIIDRTFNMPAILEASVGASWDTLPHDQQAMLADAFRRYTVASYVNSFDEYDGQRIEIVPETRAVGNDQVVQTKIIPKKGDSHELDYVMRRDASGWRVVDVLAEGSISRVAVQRSDFRRMLARNGAQGLADSLRAKSEDLMAAAS